MTARIVVIDDYPPNLRLLQTLLEAHGHIVHGEFDGESGLATTQREKPDLVICDLQMVGMDGFDVARAIRNDPELRQTPLVAVSALVTGDVRERTKAAGFDAYMEKPITVRSFVQDIEDILLAA